MKTRTLLPGGRFRSSRAPLPPEKAESGYRLSNGRDKSLLMPRESSRMGGPGTTWRSLCSYSSRVTGKLPCPPPQPRGGLRLPVAGCTTIRRRCDSMLLGVLQHCPSCKRRPSRYEAATSGRRPSGIGNARAERPTGDSRPFGHRSRTARRTTPAARADPSGTYAARRVYR